MRTCERRRRLLLFHQPQRLCRCPKPELYLARYDFSRRRQPTVRDDALRVLPARNIRERHFGHLRWDDVVGRGEWVNYRCPYSQSVPNFNNRTSNWVYVKENSGWVDLSGHPAAATAVLLPLVPNAQQTQITFGPFLNLSGAAAHEEGHENGLADCLWCGLGDTAMGSQPTWDAAHQPTSPQPCDVFWELIWGNI